MRKSICIDTLGLHVPFYERFKLIREYGFDTVEFWGKDGKNISQIKELCDEYSISISAFSGDKDFSLCDDKHMNSYVEYAEECMETAKRLNCSVLVIHSNALGEGGVVVDHYKQFSRERLKMNMLRTLLKLAPIAEKNNILLNLEPLNTLYDHIGNALYSIDESVEITRLVDSANIKVLYDIYHMHLMRGNIINTLKDNIKDIGHIHIADAPGRHEPGTGEINYDNVFSAIRELDFKGAVGFELFAKSNFENAIEIIKNI